MRVHPTTKHFRITPHSTIVGALLLLTVGCTPAIDTGNLGVSPGGTEDVAQARSEIQAGIIPDPQSITVEGMLSEHDIPISPPDGAQEFYTASAVAWRKPFGLSAAVADIFVGIGTTIPLDSFKRRPLNLVVVVDRSGSMNQPASATTYDSKMAAVKDALYTLRDRLNDGDLLTLVSFDTGVTVDLEAAPVSGEQVDRIGAAIDQLKPLGNTNIIQALGKGFELAVASAGDGRASRVMLFTDALPTEGPSGSESFVPLIGDYAGRGIEFTLMGVGADFGTDLARRISQVRGANSFYLSDDERIAGVFDSDFDFLVSPAGYDLTLDVLIPETIGIQAVYGVPDYIPGSKGARVIVPTLFFSRREGGGSIVVRLTFPEPPKFATEEKLADLSLSYTLADGSARSASLALTLPPGLSPTGDPAYFSHIYARRAALLVDTALTLRGAAQQALAGRHDDARKGLQDFLAYFDQMALGLSDRTDPSSRALSQERGVVEDLLNAVSTYSPYYGAPYYSSF